MSKRNSEDGVEAEEKPDLTTIQGRLRWARTKRGLGVRELSVLAGLSDATVSVIETKAGRRVMADTIDDLARVLKVPPEWLAWGRGSPGI